MSLISIGTILRRCASSINKGAMPYENTLDHRGMDFLFENLDSASRKRVVQDFRDGKTISIPDMRVGDRIVPARAINKKDFDQKGYNHILEQMNHVLDKPVVKELLNYDPTTQSYRLKQAKHGVSYSTASTQVDLPEDLSKKIIAWGKKNVPDEDLYTKDEDKGREDEIHTTVFYGILEDNPEKVKELLKEFKPFECRLGLITAFKDPKEYDVLKIDMEAPELIKLHYLIEQNLENKNDYPTYQAHTTIAYVNKGKADKHIGDDQFRDTVFKVSEIVLSTKDHIKIKIPLGT